MEDTLEVYKRPDEQEKRIEEILGEECEKNDNNFLKYYNYLKENISMPCILTGIEDFPWEEKYILDGWDQEEYEELKKNYPSYTDEFELLVLSEPLSGGNDIFIKAKRLSDKKIFELELSWLECTDSESKNFQLLDDFSVWQVNY